MGILPLEEQTKESARRDKRPSSLYCIGQKHLLVGASLSTVCLYCVKHLLVYFLKQLLVYFQKHLLTYFRKHLSLCRSSFVNSCWAIFYESYHLLVRLLVTWSKYYKRILDNRQVLRNSQLLQVPKFSISLLSFTRCTVW